MFFAVSSAIILVVASVIAYRSVEFMDTRTFCGVVCHRVMTPEYTADLRSAHASVQCVPCHIGPGAPWFVRSKLSGLPQVWHYTLGDYPRPLATPVRALRPSRETCQTCHWSAQFHGSVLRTRTTYRPDQSNTPEVRSMVMYVGSGGVPGSGIHGHVVRRIYYLPATARRDVIAWVRVRQPNGTARDYVDPGYSGRLASLRKERGTRRMDCIDCHNRTAHDFRPFEDLLDDALTRGAVDPSLPYIKQQALQAARAPDTVPSQAEYERALQRIGQIRAYYERRFPDVARQRPTAINRSVRAIERTYRGTYFPHMRVGPSTYPNWRSHDGCFRCHGVLETAGPGGARQTLPPDCTFCHSTQVTGTNVQVPLRP